MLRELTPNEERLAEVKEDLIRLEKRRILFTSAKAKLALTRLAEPLIHEKTILEDTEGLLDGDKSILATNPRNKAT